MSEKSSTSLEAASVSSDQLYGTCPFCFLSEAVVNGKMVEHSYSKKKNKEGFSARDGKCFGSGKIPYELSSSDVEEMILFVESQLTARIVLKEMNLAFIEYPENEFDKLHRIPALQDEVESCKKIIKKLNAKKLMLEKKREEWKEKPLFKNREIA